MKITIDMDSTDNQYRIYNSKEEYDADPESWDGWQRTHKWGTYQLRHRNSPIKFPCLMIDSGIIYNPDGPDEINNAFLYDFELIEE